MKGTHSVGPRGHPAPELTSWLAPIGSRACTFPVVTVTSQWPKTSTFSCLIPVPFLQKITDCSCPRHTNRQQETFKNRRCWDGQGIMVHTNRAALAFAKCLMSLTLAGRKRRWRCQQCLPQRWGLGGLERLQAVYVAANSKAVRLRDISAPLGETL